MQKPARLATEAHTLTSRSAGIPTTEPDVKQAGVYLNLDQARLDVDE